MKILICSMWTISDNFVGGTERFVVDLAENLASAGHAVDVLMLKGEHYTKNNVRYLSLNKLFDFEINEFSLKERFFKNLSSKSLKDFGKLLSKNFDCGDYDVVHLNSLMMLFAFTNKKRVFTLHENPFEIAHNWGKETYNLIKRVIRSQSHPNTIFSAPSIYYANLLSKNFSIDVVPLAHAVDSKRLNCKLSKKAVLKKYGLSETAKKILIPSRLEIIQKRQDLALRAIGLMSDNRSGYQVVMTGVDSQYRANVEVLKKLADSFKIQVSFITFTDMAEAYKIADIVVLPSRSESFGYAAIESLSLGIPTVMTDIPTFKQVAKDSDSSYICSDDERELSMSIIEALSKHRKQNKGWIKKYSIDKWVRGYVRLYEI